MNGLQPEPADESAAVGGDACVEEQCPDIRLFGKLAPGCCRGNDGCGGQVQIRERTWLCLPPSYDRPALALREALARHAGEPLVPDPSCPSRTIDGDTLAGCCSAAGQCGSSTAPWTAEAARFGLRIPSACISPAEAARLTGTASADIGPAPACGPGTTR